LKLTPFFDGFARKLPMLKRVFVAPWSTGPWCSAVHSAALFVCNGWRLGKASLIEFSRRSAGSKASAQSCAYASFVLDGP
jgi:hypothetical protein